VSWFSLRKLKKLRIVVSLFFFLSYCVLFLDPWHSVPVPVGRWLTSLQFIPGLTVVFVYIGIFTVGFALVVLMTMLFGRVYCSSICPLGTLQDIILYLENKFRKKKRYKYESPPFKFQYLFFIVIGAIATTGSMTLFNLFEPFSNFGRLLTGCIKPEVVFLNNILADVSDSLNLFWLYQIPYGKVELAAALFAILMLGILVVLTYNHGRLFCNSLCPAGAILSAMSRVSVFKLVIDETSCNGCGACERVCKARCISSDGKKIDYSACIGCFNCIKSCPTSGVTFRSVFSGDRQPEPKVNISRRQLFRTIVTNAAIVALPSGIGNKQNERNENNYFKEKLSPISPPGSLGVVHLSNFCTACHLCISSCPTNVLVPAVFDYGIGGIFQPKMDYNVSYCNYDCTICSQVCPNGAIIPVEAEEKRRIQIGKVNFFKEDCVVLTKKTDCAACSEHCPTKAVHTVPYEGKLRLPEINNEICVGCGACEHACPVLPRKAIYVSSNPLHATAKEPAVKKQEPNFESSKDFPF